MKRLFGSLLIFATAPAPAAAERPPIIDMHLHALPADAQGPPPVALCTPIPAFEAWDQRRP